MIPLRICAEPGCPRPTQQGSPRCAAHHAQHARGKSKRRGYSAHAAGYGARWERTSKAYLKAHPLCECYACAPLLAGERDQSEEVHHIDGLGPNGPRGHDWSNLLSMSHRHHSALTARDHRTSPLTSADTLRTLQMLARAHHHANCACDECVGVDPFNGPPGQMPTPHPGVGP